MDICWRKLSVPVTDPCVTRLFIQLALAFTLGPLVLRASFWDGDPFAHPELKKSPIEITSMQMKDGFGAQFWLVPDSRFRLPWTEADVRKLNSVSATRRNIPLEVAVFFVNAGQEDAYYQMERHVTKQKVIDVTFDLKVIRPDGIVYNHPGLPGHSGIAPPPFLLKLVKAKATITFDTEPTGVYKIMVVVHDRFRKIDIRLERTLQVLD